MKIIVQADGGAARGYFILMGMEHIEGQTNLVFTKHPALLSGTSTGTLICGCLAAKVEANALLAKYTKYIPRLFKKRKIINPRRWSKGVFDRKPFLKVINETLDEYAPEDNKKELRLKDLLLSFMATAYSLDEDRTMFFKSNDPKDGYIKLIDVMAWSALSAANYFGSIAAKVRDVLHVFQDGGQGIKNCTLLDCIDECEIRGWAYQEECIILSFGCGYTKRGRDAKKVKRWGIFKQIKDYLVGGQARDEATFDQIRRAKARAKRNKNLTVFRFDVEISKKMADFDYRNVEGLIKKGTEYCLTQEMENAVIYLKKKLG
jgi:hypothetical protein